MEGVWMGLVVDDAVVVVTVLLEDAVHGVDLHKGRCTAAAELIEGSFLKMPSGLIIFPSTSVESAILIGWGCDSASCFLTQIIQIK